VYLFVEVVQAVTEVFQPSVDPAGRKTSCLGRRRCGNLQQVRAGAGRL